jgi:hypothetical protein
VNRRAKGDGGLSWDVARDRCVASARSDTTAEVSGSPVEVGGGPGRRQRISCASCSEIRRTAWSSQTAGPMRPEGSRQESPVRPGKQAAAEVLDIIRQPAPTRSTPRLSTAQPPPMTRRTRVAGTAVKGERSESAGHERSSCP